MHLEGVKPQKIIKKGLIRQHHPEKGQISVAGLAISYSAVTARRYR